jgi:hypothetical protein
LNLLGTLHNLRHNDFLVKENTKEFKYLAIRLGKNEKSEEVILKYVNRLRFSTQYETSMVRLYSVVEAYPLMLKVEEKLERK